MDTFLIAFQIHSDSIYPRIAECIRTYPKWARIMKNVWIIQSDKKLFEVRGSISSLVDENEDSVLVIKINNDAWGTYAVKKEVTDWMKENI